MKNLLIVSLLLLTTSISATPPGQYRLQLNSSMLSSEFAHADFSGVVDEQLDAGDPPSGKPSTPWKINSQYNKEFPVSFQIDLGKKLPLASLWLFDTNNKGDVEISVGGPGKWEKAGAYDCGLYLAWAQIPLDKESRFLKVTLMSPGAIFSEIVLDSYSDTGWSALQNKIAEKKRLEGERIATLNKAREEALKRPVIELAPFGRLSLVDHVDCGKDDPGHMMRVDPSASAVRQDVLDKPCRILKPVKGECSYMTFRLGAQKLLCPGAPYVLVVEYPEDDSRSMVVINTGCETSHGFHTGMAVGDALHPKYVNNYVESLDMPLSGKWERWTQLFYLHDRFAEKGLIRGSERSRILFPEDGFDVTIAQFSAKNDPLSQGAAVGRIMLFEVVDPDKLPLKINFPPDGLPRRRLFWREEMADCVIAGKHPQDRGINNPIDWYRFKAEQMRFLGMNTYTKDLLEFGACQHWDSTGYGGNKWVYFNSDSKNLWKEIVTLMGGYGFDVLPYYEYSGSKGSEGLGPQRRAKPLSRDDAYSHIKWIESSNADITDPDTYDDFKKMLDLTVLKLQDKAGFAGIWLRPRSQLPIGFGPATLKRFAEEVNQGKALTRDDLKKDKALYKRYIDWWHLKRRDFLMSMRDYLKNGGVKNAMVLFTGCSSEPGPGFHDFESRLITDSPDAWKPVLAKAEHALDNNRQWQVLTPGEVAEKELYKNALITPAPNWGGWENHHSNPADDPANYIDQESVLLTYPFNRLYTVNDPRAFDMFRTKSGLAMVRHYTLNENMMFDADDKEKLGYFVADIERAGSACMQAEVLAVANGDPTMIGYLVGNNFSRGFPSAVREFNANFLALPALPGKVLTDASSDKSVVVRAIRTAGHGTYFAVINTSPLPVKEVKIKLPVNGSVTACASGEKLDLDGNVLTLDMHAYQLLSIH